MKVGIMEGDFFVGLPWFLAVAPQNHVLWNLSAT